MSLLLTTVLLACQNPQVAVLLDDGEVSVPWMGWAENGPVLPESQADSFWWTVRFPHAVVQPPEDSWSLSLADGAWLPGKPVIGAESPRWKLAGLPVEVEAMPLDTLWLQSVGRDRLPPADEERDQLWSRTAAGTIDRLQGYLIDWTGEGISFETSVKERLVSWEQLEALTVLTEEVEVQSQAVWIQLVNGGVLSARILAADQSEFQLQLPWGAAWSLPVGAVTRIRRRADVAEWAGPGATGGSTEGSAWSLDLLPQAEALDYTPKTGKSIEGRPLRPGAGAGVFAQGIGVMVPTTLSHPVDGPGTLLVTVGVDQEVSAFRSPQPVRFQVLLDGAALADSGSIAVADGQKTLLIQIPGSGTLQFQAQPSKVLPFGGHADWCDLVWRAGE